MAFYINTWLSRGENRSTLSYAVDRKHAQHLHERFLEAGVSAEYVDRDTAMFEREEIFERFRSSDQGHLQCCNARYRVDFNVRCIIDARPTKSRIRFVQTIGRGLRPGEGKDHLIVLDHAGNHRRLGLITAITSSVLDDGENVHSAERSKETFEPDIKLCQNCHCLLPPPRARECPACFEPIYAITLVKEREGELVELGSAQVTRPVSLIDEALWHGALAKIARKKGYKPGWAAHKFKEKFGRNPASRFPVEQEPTIEIWNWVRSRQIAYAKARNRYG